MSDLSRFEVFGLPAVVRTIPPQSSQNCVAIRFRMSTNPCPPSTHMMIYMSPHHGGARPAALGAQRSSSANTPPSPGTTRARGTMPKWPSAALTASPPPPGHCLGVGFRRHRGLGGVCQDGVLGPREPGGDGTEALLAAMRPDGREGEHAGQLACNNFAVNGGGAATVSRVTNWCKLAGRREGNSYPGGGTLMKATLPLKQIVHTPPTMPQASVPP